MSAFKERVARLERQLEEAKVEPLSADADGHQQEKGFNAEKAQEKLRLKIGESKLALRKKYAPRLFWIAWLWIAVIVVVLAVQFVCKHGLNDGVIITLLSTTTINIIGLLYVVVKYLFNDA